MAMHAKAERNEGDVTAGPTIACAGLDYLVATITHMPAAACGTHYCAPLRATTGAADLPDAYASASLSS